MTLPLNFTASVIERPNLYWSNRTGGKDLERLNTDGTGNKIIVKQATGLTIDKAIVYYKNWLYIINGANPQKVARCELNGSNLETLVTGTGDLRQLTVCDDGLFWSNYLNGNTSIFRADLDGSNVATIYTDYAGIEGLDNDGINLYFYERDFDTDVKAIKKMDFDGSNLTTITTNVDNGTAVRDVDVTGNYIYWLNSGGTTIDSRIMRCDKDGSNITTIVSSSDAAQKGLFSLVVGETEIYYLIAFGSSPVDAGIYKCNIDGSNFPTKLLGGEPYPFCLALA
tara:strand:+ start:12654 stop:13499 length:846 start_codon:yes stop_codon:yes gene_type:complete